MGIAKDQSGKGNGALWANSLVGKLDLWVSWVTTLVVALDGRKAIREFHQIQTGSTYSKNHVLLALAVVIAMQLLASKSAAWARIGQLWVNKLHHWLSGLVLVLKH